MFNVFPQKLYQLDRWKMKHIITPNEQMSQDFNTVGNILGKKVEYNY